MRKRQIRNHIILFGILLLVFLRLFISDEASAANVILVEVGDYSIEGDGLVPGQETTLSLTVRNISESTLATNVVLSLYSNAGSVLPAYGTDNQYYIGRLAGNEKKTIDVPLKVSSGLSGESVELTCNFSYLNEDTRISNSVVILLPVAAGAPAHIEIESFSIDSDAISPGKDITLRLNIHNTSISTSANNVILSLGYSLGAIFPAYGTDNQYYIGTLAEDERKTVDIPLSVSNGFSEAGTEIICDFEYNSGAEKRSDRLTLALPDAGWNPITAKSVEIGPTAIINSKTLLSLTLWNKSSSNISDARLLISGNVSGDSKVIKLDTLIAEQNYSEDCQITFTEPGRQEIDIVLKYTDLNNQEKEINIGSYTVNVSSEALEYNKSASKRGLKALGTVISGVAILAAFGTLYVYVRRR